MNSAWIAETLKDCPANMRVEEVANVCRVSRRTVGRWIAAGTLRAKKLGSTVVVPRCAVAEMLAGSADA